MHEQERRPTKDHPVITYVEDAEAAPTPGARLPIDHVSQRSGGEILGTWRDPNRAGTWVVTDVIPLGDDGRRVRVFLEAPECPDLPDPT